MVWPWICIEFKPLVARHCGFNAIPESGDEKRKICTPNSSRGKAPVPKGAETQEAQGSQTGILPEGEFQCGRGPRGRQEETGQAALRVRKEAPGWS